MPKIINKASIAILMATYNGENYLREQIDSILCQTNQDWTLYVQDDGSKDATLDIIKSYDDERIVLVDVGLTRQGACMNFMSLLNMVESEYYMFCDQDDVWFVDKVEKSLGRMKKEEMYYGKDKPILVFSDASVIQPYAASTDSKSPASKTDVGSKRSISTADIESEVKGSASR